MNKRLLRSLLIAIPVTACALLLIRASAADASLPGETWETTSQPTMEGMPAGFQMPVTKLAQCVARNRTEPPVALNPQGNCTNSGYKQSGNKVSWVMQCTDPASSGTGEIVYAADRRSYTGAIQIRSAQGNMTIRLTGTRGADCAKPQ
jgi:hypothetical protein